MTRWKAAATHLLISSLLFAAVAILVLWLWYPPAMLELSGVDELIGIIAAIDIVAGPLLTLIVFKAGKPRLKLDLTIIACVQFALLAYGLHTLASVRPIFLVGVVDRFELMIANDIDSADLARARAPFNRRSWTGPLYVGALLPTDASERNAQIERALAGKDIQFEPYYYVPFEQVRESLLERSTPLSTLLSKASAEDKERLVKAIGSDEPESFRYVPIHGQRANALMLIDTASGKPLRPVAVDPWK